MVVYKISRRSVLGQGVASHEQREGQRGFEV